MDACIIDVRSGPRGPKQSGVRLNEGQRKESWEWRPGVGDLRLMGTRETSHRSRAAPIFTPLTLGREVPSRQHAEREVNSAQYTV